MRKQTTHYEMNWIASQQCRSRHRDQCGHAVCNNCKGGYSTATLHARCNSQQPPDNCVADDSCHTAVDVAVAHRRQAQRCRPTDVLWHIAHSERSEAATTDEATTTDHFHHPQLPDTITVQYKHNSLKCSNTKLARSADKMLTTSGKMLV